MTETLVNGRWLLDLPPHRAARESWPWWEAERLAAMHHHIEPGDVVYDIGAEEGDFPALYASWGAQVVLVEPNPYVWPCIRWTWEANDLPAPLGWFVGLLGDKPAEPVDNDTEAWDDRGWPHCAYREMIGDHGFRHLGEHGGRNTPVSTLDALVADVGTAPDVVTMDVEGGELHVLKGAHRTLTEHRPIVFVSVHPQFMEDLYGIVNGTKAVVGHMTDIGYTAEFLTTDHEEHWMFLP